MSSHVFVSADPVVGVELGVSPPGVAVLSATAPLAAGDVVVEVDVDVLAQTLGGNGVVDLQALGLGCELRVVREDLLEDGGAVLCAEALLKGCL